MLQIGRKGTFLHKKRQKSGFFLIFRRTLAAPDFNQAFLAGHFSENFRKFMVDSTGRKNPRSGRLEISLVGAFFGVFPIGHLTPKMQNLGPRGGSDLGFFAHCMREARAESVADD